MEKRADKEAEADRAPSRLNAISSNLSARALAFVKCIFPCRQNLVFLNYIFIFLNSGRARVNRAGRKPVRAGRSALGNSWNTEVSVSWST